tara:strand:- start:5308 stop:5586 length:279 start_codon:yes stop_codon:yes gene_type:complete
MSYGKPIVFNPALDCHISRIGEVNYYPISHYQLINDNRFKDILDNNSINLINNHKVLRKFKITGIHKVEKRFYNPNIPEKFQGFMMKIVCVG